MAFDIETARKDGHSDAEIADYLAQSRKFDIKQARADGHSDEDILKYLSSTPAPGAAPAAKPKAPVGGSADVLGSIVQTVSEPLATMGTGTVASIAAALGGGGTALLGGDGAKVRDKIMESMTYQPRSAGGKAVMHAIDAPFKWLAGKAGDAGQAVMDKTGSPTLATATDVGINALPMVAGGLLGRSGVYFKDTPETAAARAAERAKNAKTDASITNARDKGYVMSPGDANGGPIGTGLASVSGEPKLQKVLSRKNQPVTDRLVARDLGLPEDMPISGKELAGVRAEAGKVYEEVRGLGQITTDQSYAKALQEIVSRHEGAEKSFPTGRKDEVYKLVESLNHPSFDSGAAVDKVRLLREDADIAYRKGEARMGKAYKAAAQAIEDQIDRHLQHLAQTPAPIPQAGPALPGPKGTAVERFKPTEKDITPQPEQGPQVTSDLINRWRDARERIAKSYVAQKALNEASGHFDAAVYARELKKETPLTGPARDVAEFAQSFPRSAQRVEKLGTPGGPTLFDAALGMGGKEWMLAFARPALRHLLASRPAQSMLVRPGNYERGISGLLAEQAAQKAGILGPMGQAELIQSLLRPNE